MGEGTSDVSGSGETGGKSQRRGRATREEGRSTGGKIDVIGRATGVREGTSDGSGSGAGVVEGTSDGRKKEVEEEECFRVSVIKVLKG